MINHLFNESAMVQFIFILFNDGQKRKTRDNFVIAIWHYDLCGSSIHDVMRRAGGRVRHDERCMTKHDKGKEGGGAKISSKTGWPYPLFRHSSHSCNTHGRQVFIVHQHQIHMSFHIWP